MSTKTNLLDNLERQGISEANGNNSLILALATSTWAIVTFMSLAEISPMTKLRAMEISFLYVTAPLFALYFSFRLLPAFARVSRGTTIESTLEKWRSFAKNEPVLHGILAGGVITIGTFAIAAVWINATGDVPAWFSGLMGLIP